MTTLSVAALEAPRAHATPGRITFNRPPRLPQPLSTSRLEIPTPPQPAQKPSTTLGSGLFVPIIAMLAMGALFFVGAASGGDRSYMIIVAVALGVGSGLPVAWMFFEERRRFKRQAREQVEQYGRRVRNTETELARLRDEEQQLRTELDPAPPVLAERARRRGGRLWERRLSDRDFLCVRLGTGMDATHVTLEFREHGFEPDQAPPELARLMREAHLLLDQYRRVPDVPVRVDFQHAGAACLVGPYPLTADLARAALCQLAVHHSPDDLRLAGFLDPDNLPDWAWLKWLPHTRGGVNGAPTLLAWQRAERERLSRWLLEELTGRKRAMESTSTFAWMGDAPGSASPWLLVFVDDLKSAPKDPALRMALSEGLRLRVAVLGLAEDLRSVPAGCGAVAVVEETGEAVLSYARARSSDEPVPAPHHLAVDQFEVLGAERTARALAPLVLVDESIETQTADIPARITFFEALGISSIDELDVEASWQPRSGRDRLRAPLGVTSGGDLLWVDLKEQSQGGDGPHGLVAGTTGAGKSELLLTLIAGLALRHPPSVLNFVLVDYKGGDAFKAVEKLPHTVSLITDLDQHLAARALVTLRSEIKRREHRLLELRAAGVHSIAEYQQRGQGEPMPFLVIVVDEFARLKDELPDFIDGLIDVARVGRSLGVHLILATQTPSGTVDDQIQKNTNYGICLRVRDPIDSREVIGEPDAALLPGSLPGRGYFRAGLDPLRQFQTARVGARYEARSAAEAFDITPFEPMPWAVSRFTRHGVHSVAVEGAASNQTEVAHLVARLAEVATASGNVARLWPAPLPEVVDLLALTGEAPDWNSPPEWLTAPVGLVDEPSQQAQHPFRLDVGRNCLIYGGAGSGKSTLLRSLATSLALSHSPRNLHIYCLDFDSRTLGVLGGLPHCGLSGVFLPRDTLRIRRLFRMLEHELHRRRELGIGNLRQQRRTGSDAAAPPFILILLDNFAAFRETFEGEEDLMRSTQSMVADLATLMRDGSAAGISFVLTAGVPGSVASPVANAVDARVTLRQNDPSDYFVVGRLEHPPEQVPAGRGFAVGNPPREFQVGVPPEDPSELFAALRAGADGAGPMPVQDLPTRVELSDPRLSLAPDSHGLTVVLGLDDEHFGPLTVDLTDAQHMVVIGPTGSGKTSLLASIVAQAVGVDWYAVLPRTSALSAAGGFVSNARNVVQLAEMLDVLETLVEERREKLHHESPTEATADAPILLVFDDYELLRQDDEFYDVESRLARLARRGGVVGLHVLVAGNNVELRDARDDLIRYLSQLRVGVLLQPDVEFDGDLFTVRLPRQVDAPPRGRGYFIQRHAQRLFQAALSS